MSYPTILLPRASSPTQEVEPKRRVPPPPRPHMHHLHPHQVHSWDDLPQENVIRTPSVQGFYPPSQSSVDWERTEQLFMSGRILVARQHHTHQGQNIVVDYLTAYYSPVWVRYTVVYEQGEPSPFPAY